MCQRSTSSCLIGSVGGRRLAPSTAHRVMLLLASCGARARAIQVRVIDEALCFDVSYTEFNDMIASLCQSSTVDDRITRVCAWLMSMLNNATTPVATLAAAIALFEAATASTHATELGSALAQCDSNDE